MIEEQSIKCSDWRTINYVSTFRKDRCGRIPLSKRQLWQHFVNEKNSLGRFNYRNRMTKCSTTGKLTVGTIFWCQNKNCRFLLSIRQVEQYFNIEKTDRREVFQFEKTNGAGSHHWQLIRQIRQERWKKSWRTSRLTCWQSSRRNRTYWKISRRIW